MKPTLSVDPTEAISSKMMSGAWGVRSDYFSTLVLIVFLTILAFPGCQKNTEDTKDIADISDADAASDSDADSETDADPDTDSTPDLAAIGMIPFNQQKILEYHITMEPALLAEMEAYGNDEEYRSAALHVIGEDVDKEYGEVGFRYKGAWSLHHC